MVLPAHDHIRVDDFYWMKERGSPAVESFLTAENRRADQFIEGYSRLRASWEDRWRAGQPMAARTPAFALGGYLYEWQSGGGAPALLRRPVGTRQRAQMVVDTSVYGARGLGFNQGAVEISPDHRRAAIAFERVGSERFSVRLRDIDRNRDLGYAIDAVGPSLAWLDDTTLLYTRLDDRGIPTQVWRHRVAERAADTLVYQEADPTLFVGVVAVASDQLAVIVSAGHSSNEIRMVHAGGGPPQLVVARQGGVQYDAQPHGRGAWYALVQTDDGSRLLVAPGPGPAGPDWSRWRTVYASADPRRAVQMAVYRHHVVVAEEGPAARLVVIAIDGERTSTVALPGTELPNTFSLRFGRDYADPHVWVVSSGPANPGTIHQVDPVSGAAEAIHQAPAPKGFQADGYVVDQWTATAPDGTQVPMSVFFARRPDTSRPPGPRPAVLHGYGAFGISSRPGFSRPALSLADRGWVLAYAHVRGGGELGPAWHGAGRRGCKVNSFLDFVACGRRLAASDLVDGARMAARGASAGGLLVCAAVNYQPDLFRAVVARVPTVDCLTSLLDPSNRLTQSLWDELGNPIHDVEVYRYILSYSPYDNLRPCAYPALLVTAAYHDARVPYWEPAKYVARLRVTRTDDRPLLLRTAMESGHDDRWDERSDESYMMAFLVSQLE